jgi:hypothetical protein
MRESGEVEGKAYMEKLFAKWKAYREGIATRREVIRDKLDDHSRANWANFFLICIVGGGVQTGSTRHVGHSLAYCTCPG